MIYVDGLATLHWHWREELSEQYIIIYYYYYYGQKKRNA